MDFLTYEFMQNALIAILIITPLFSLLGTMIVNNKMAFFSDALGHSALTGIALGVVLGIQNTVVSMIIFGIVFAVILNIIKNSKVASLDTIISVMSSAAIALGLAILSKGGNFENYSSLLIGDILSINKKEILLLIVINLFTFLFYHLYSNKIIALSVNKQIAKSKNINTKLLDNIFVILIAVTVMLSIKWVGILIINALFILPAAASRNISKNMREYTLYTIIFSMFSGVCGLILSYYLDIGAGPTIVLVISIIFCITYLFRKTFTKDDV